jgi:hypothetical protein
MAANPESEDKPAELVGGPPPSAQPVRDRRRTFFDPSSGLVILGVDWIAFGVNLPTKFLLTPLICLIAFGVTFWAVARIQRDDGDSPRTAYLKAFLGALAAGVPFPIAGTVVGAAILLLSGLPRLPFRRR